jgi:chemotaxis protein methyltransferase CheR
VLPNATPVRLNPEEFVLFRDLLAQYSGTYLDQARQRVLEHWIGVRLTITGDTIVAYERRLRSFQGRAELHELTELVLNHETFFFRNQPHMQALRQVVLPELHKRKPVGEPIRIWSAGCASGEEAYSIAIVAHETLSGRPVEIWGTDLSALTVERARVGYYRGRALTHVAPALLERYFRPQGHGYVVTEQLRNMVTFETANLLEPFPPQVHGVDLIFCQNVLIYFQTETNRLILERFYQNLPDDGMLFLGFAETIWNLVQGFRPREIAGSYIYVKTRVDSKKRSTQSKAPEMRPTERSVTAQKPRPARIFDHGAQPVAPNNRRSSSSAPSAAISDDRVLLAESQQLIEQGALSTALERLSRIAPNSTHGAQALVLVAKIHADRGELELAVAEIKRALQIEPMLDRAYTLLGVIYARQELWAEAIQNFERARYLDPTAPLLSFYLADAYRQAGQTVAATREYRSTLRKLSSHPAEAVIDGVALSWVRETCQRRIRGTSSET